MKWFIFVVIILLFLRFILFFLYSPHLKSGETISFHTTLFDDPKDGSRYNTLTANYKNFFGSEKIFVTYSPKLNLSYGDEVAITGKIEKRVINNKNTILTMYFPQIEPVKNQQNPLLAVIGIIRQQIKNLYFETLPKDQAGLLLGIVLGIKANFSKQFYQYLQTSGVLHVIAASGMNITMVAGFLFSTSVKFLRRQTAIIVSICGILVYMAFSGFSPSIVRAGIMGILVFIAQLLGRQYTALYGLFFTAGVMLLWNPSLITDVGFQLSVLSTLGIVVFTPIFPKSPIFDDLRTTISAQVFTLPILLTTFGTYGLASILVNFLVLWTIPILMILGGIGALAGLVFERVGTLLIWISGPFLWFFIKVVIYSGELSWNFELKQLSLFLIIGYYLVLVSIISFVYSKNKEN